MKKQTKQESIKILRMCANDTEDADKVEVALSMAISALEKQINGGWIPCNERLPSEGELVLVTVNNPLSDQPIVLQNYSERLDYWKDGTILAWQPLPPQYKEDK